jgi:hypothetical protein
MACATVDDVQGLAPHLPAFSPASKPSASFSAAVESSHARMWFQLCRGAPSNILRSISPALRGAALTLTL